MIRTVKLSDDKYEFDVDAEYGLIVAARRNGEPWRAGLELRASKVVGCMLARIIELEDATKPSAPLVRAVQYVLKRNAINPETIGPYGADTKAEAIEHARQFYSPGNPCWVEYETGGVIGGVDAYGKVWTA